MIDKRAAARVLLVADGPTGRGARLWINDVDITRATQRLSIEMSAGGLTTITATILPLDGLSIDVPGELVMALVPGPGYQWINEPRADGEGWILRCERVPE